MTAKFDKIIILAFELVITGANAVYAIPQKLLPFKSSISELLIVMVSIIIFLVVLFIGLTIYNKFFVARKMSDYELRKYNLADSVDKDDSILNYVSKNRLR